MATDNADSHGARGAALLDGARALQTAAMASARDRSVEAAELYRRAAGHLSEAARLAPGSAQARRLLGVALLELGDAAGAHHAFCEAYALAPDDARVAADYAGSAQARGETGEAITAYERALARHPDDALLHGGLALSLLGRGDFARGWDEYEWRLKAPGATGARTFPFPAWRGEDLAGRSLFVSSEQGLGDEIMFASCFGELIARAKLCVLEVSRRLAPLFRRSFPRALVVERNLKAMPDWTRLPPIDLWISAGSVPRHLRRRLEDFPRHAGYLIAKSERWRAELDALGSGPKIGLAWTGGLPNTLRALRSLRLADLLPLLEMRGARFVALEFIDPRREIAALDEPLRPAWWPEAARDPDELAALISRLDRVVSVTTSAAHLSGALGRPTTILVPAAPTWRYLWAGERIPWYPSARVLRRQPGVTLEEFIRSAAPPA